MDNENLNPYDQMMPQPDDPDKNSEKNKERKKHGFAAGVGVGVAAGTAGTIVIAIVGVFIYMAVFGHTLGEGLTTAGNELLDSSTVSKVDELKSYIDKYYYDDYDKEELQNGILQGLVEGLGDQYSVYYTADDYKQLPGSDNRNILWYRCSTQTGCRHKAGYDQENIFRHTIRGGRPERG